MINYVLIFIQGEDSDSDGKGWSFFEYVIGAVVFVLVVVAVPYVIGAVGFTPAGIAAFSIAAYVQSVFYGAVVGPGSLFAFLQSAGVAYVSLSGMCILYFLRAL